MGLTLLYVRVELPILALACLPPISIRPYWPIKVSKSSRDTFLVFLRIRASSFSFLLTPSSYAFIVPYKVQIYKVLSRFDHFIFENSNLLPSPPKEGLVLISWILLFVPYFVLRISDLEFGFRHYVRADPRNFKTFEFYF